MAGDYTRLTFDPLRDRAMVLEQQGRVHLDADFNELVAILERRLRVETRDFAGPAVVPAALPHSFEIKLLGLKAMIGPGRMYVDGLLAENHGYGERVYEPVWDEPGYDGWTPIDKQPYLGTPVSPAVEGNLLVYLDVWQREETAAEDESLVESALGVDTCTRVQTVWQVRTLRVDRSLTCDSQWDEYPPWIAATRPSAGRLTSRADNPPLPSDPCAVAPFGGYRGLENRLYRVEIHDGGGAGEATFKWSRDNGAVASPVTAVDDPAKARVITVERLGRDAVLRFRQNDWVELLDDTHELDGKPGLMGQVLETDPTENTVTLANPLAGAIDPTRNPRLRRWDQQEGVGTDGVIPIAALPFGFFKLEDGVEVELELSDPAGGFKTGDWWVFAARAATASIEELKAVPPRGIRHHYARLAVIRGKQVSDCRVIFPGACEPEGGCACTACVTPQSHAGGTGPLTLQAAIDKVAATGGRVCVEPGHYTLTEPLAIRNARGLTLAGAGSATVIAYAGEARCGILVEDSVEVSLERFALTVARSGHQPRPVAGQPATRLQGGGGPPDAGGSRAEGGSRGAGRSRAAREVAAGTVGIALANTAACRVERCLVLVGLVPGSRQKPAFNVADVGIGLSGWALSTRLIENVILAQTAIGDLAGKRSGGAALDRERAAQLAADPAMLKTQALSASYSQVAPRSYLVTIDLGIRDNMLLGARAGIDFAGPLTASKEVATPTIHLGPTRIADNLILGGSIAGIMLFGLGAGQKGSGGLERTSGAAAVNAGAGASLEAVPALALRLGAGEVSVTGNAILVSGDGIRTTPDALRIADNVLVGSTAGTEQRNAGISLAGDRGAAGDHASITGNLVRGFGLGGVIARGWAGALAVSCNRVMDIGETAIAVLTFFSHQGDVAIADNAISSVGEILEPETASAIWVRGATVVRVTGNAIARVGAGGWRGDYLAAVSVACDTGEVAGNLLTEVGPETEHVGLVAGIAAARFAALDVRGNTVTLGYGGGVSQDIPLLIGQTPSAGRDFKVQLILGPFPLTANVGAVSGPGPASNPRTASNPGKPASNPGPASGPGAASHPGPSSNPGAASNPSVAGADGEGVDPMPLGRPDLAVHGNTLYARGREPVAVIATESNVLLAENRCRRQSEEGDRPVVLVETLDATIVSANRVEGARAGQTRGYAQTRAIDLHVGEGLEGEPHCTVLGNITDGPIELNDNPLASPWAPLNIIA